MSHTPTSRPSSFKTPQRPSTPDSTPSTLSRSGCYAVAPKSEYLRNALQARRAQTTPTPAPQDVKPIPPPSPKPIQLKTTRTSPDEFDEFALSEEQTTPVSPIRRKRPNDVGPPPTKTNRELTAEMERLKDTLITTNMRVELLKKDNKKLQHNLTEAKEQIERLEPFEDETYELRAENQQLKMKMEEMDEEMANLKEINEDQRKMNEELTDIASESAAHWSAHESAIDEAAEYIIKMEEEKDLLSKELKQLKERVMAIESNSPCSTLIDSPDKFPSRMYSIDESRPSTSHFDSDYYSQPASPQTKQSRESIDSFSPSERSKKFLDLTEERRRSAKELVHRLSVASLKALRDAPLSPAQQSPHVSTMYQQHIPTIIEDERSETPRNTKRHHKEHQALPPSLLDAAEISPPRPHTVAPHAPAPQQDGLRGLYRPNRSSTSRTSNELRSSSSQISRPTNPATFTDRPHSTIETSHRVSSGGSGNNRNSGSFSDRLSRRFPRHRQSQSDMDLRSGDSTQPIPLALVSPEWDKKAPNASPPISNASEVDLTTEIDPREDKERWWRSMDRLNLSQLTKTDNLRSSMLSTLNSKR